MLSTGSLREAQYANRYVVSLRTSYNWLCRHCLSVKKKYALLIQSYKRASTNRLSVPFTRSPFLRNFRGESQTDPICASRQSHVPTNLLTRCFSCASVRLETWRPLPSQALIRLLSFDLSTCHTANSSLLWYSYHVNWNFHVFPGSVKGSFCWQDSSLSEPNNLRNSCLQFLALEIVSMWWCFIKWAEGCHVALWHYVLP